MSTYIVILTEMKHIVLYVTTNNIWYNSAKPYTIHQRGYLIDNKREQGEIGKIVSINPLFAVIHQTDFSPQLFASLL